MLNVVDKIEIITLEDNYIELTSGDSYGNGQKSCAVERQ